MELKYITLKCVSVHKIHETNRYRLRCLKEILKNSELWGNKLTNKALCA